MHAHPTLSEVLDELFKQVSWGKARGSFFSMFSLGDQARSAIVLMVGVDQAGLALCTACSPGPSHLM